MEKLKKQVARARRRLALIKFLQMAPWCLLVTLTIALLAIALPKFVFLPMADANWPWIWLGGAVAAGFFSAGLGTWLTRRREIDAALEIDRRYGLNERISSAVAIDATTRDSEFGTALVHDAGQMADRIEIAAAFPLRLRWHGLLPAVTSLCAVALAVYINDATGPELQASSVNRHALTQEFDRSFEDLKDKLAQQQKMADEQGQTESQELFELLQQDLNKLQQKNRGDYNKTLVEFNNLAKKLEQRQSELGGAKKLQKQLEQLNSVDHGPADALAKALKNGRWDTAQKEIQDLAKKLQSNELSEDELKKLQKQIAQLKQQLSEIEDAYRRAVEELEDQIEKAKQNGDDEKAQELQKKLDQLKQQQSQMDRLNNIAKKLGQCEQCIGEGDPQAAAKALKEMEADFQELDSQSGELKSLSEAMDSIAEAKDAVRQAWQAQANASSTSGSPGNGLGDGTGQGERPEQETASETYRSRVRGAPKKGEVQRIGDADGSNQSGESLVHAREQIASALKEDSDPVVNEKLPRLEKRHTTEYFEKIRKTK